MRNLHLALGAAATALAATNTTAHGVTVGANGLLTFGPSTVFARDGDVIQFVFYPANHSVTQSSSTSPCTPLPGGFFSGFVPTSNTTAATTFLVNVTGMDPLYFFSSQGTECQSGMVGIVNPRNITQSSLAAAALNASSFPPPPGGPAGGVLETIATLSNDTTTTILSTATPTPVSTASSSGTSTAAGSGIVAGAPTTSGTPTGGASSSSSSAAAARATAGMEGIRVGEVVGWGMGVGVVGMGMGMGWVW